MRRALTIPLALFAFFALAGLALAGGNGPAAGEEYILDIPGANGNDPGSPAGTSPDSGSALPTGTEDELLQEGADGAEAAELARETDPGGGGQTNGGSSDGDQAVTGVDDGSGIGDVVADLASGSDSGMGLFLPIVLVLALGGALALVVWRRRASGS